MTKDDLARQLTEMDGWEWMPGMLETGGGRLMQTYYVPPVGDRTDEHCWAYTPDGDSNTGLNWLWPQHTTHFVPDLDDRATAWCLVAMLEEQYNNNIGRIWRNHLDGTYHVTVWRGPRGAGASLGKAGASFGEAVARCLLAAGGPS